MGVKATFSMNDIRKRLDVFLTEIEKKQIARLQRLGEMCVTHAKSLPPDIGFHDQTGNLRSSIGYVVFKDGVAIHQNYEQTGAGSEGVQAGQELANRVGSQFKGITLVVTAGMNYASYVEAKGRDVLASAEMLAQRELPRMLDKLIENIRAAAE